MHPHGSLPLLQLLAPRAPRFFGPAPLALMGTVDAAFSKKAPAQRRAELLPGLLPPLLRLCASHAAALATSPHGSAVLFETLRVAAGEEAVGGVVVDVSALTDSHAQALAALAAAATSPPPPPPAAAAADATADAEFAHMALVVHPYSARLYKRLVQAHATFATALWQTLRGRLGEWALEGAGWVVLALAESAATGEAVKEELQSTQSALAKSAAPGCLSLSQALPALPPKAAKKASKGAAVTSAATAESVPKKEAKAGKKMKKAA